MSLSATALVTLDQTFAHLGWGAGTHGEDVANLEAAIESASVTLNGLIGCTLAKTTYTATKIDGSGKAYLFLPAWPVTTLTSITEDDVLLVKDTDYYADITWGILEKAKWNWPWYDIQARWTSRRQGILFVGIAGYDIVGTLTNPLPGDIKQACLMQSAEFWKRTKDKSWGETSKTIGGQTTTYNDKEVLPFVEMVARKYRRIQI